MSITRRSALSVLAGGLVLAASGSAGASPASSLRIPADPTAIVEVSGGSVDIAFVGTKHERVEILDADLPAGWSVTLDGGGARVRIVFEGIGVPSSGSVRIGVPRSCDLRVQGMGGDISATTFDGDANVATIDGDVELAGSPRRALVATTSGDIRLTGVRDEAELATVNGRVEVEDVQGVLRANAVSGDIRVRKARTKRTTLATVSGNVDLGGTLVDGPHEVDTHAGDVMIRLDPKRSLHVRARSFSGTITDGLVKPAVQARSRYERTQGDDPAELVLGTFSGDIELQPLKPT